MLGLELLLNLAGGLREMLRLIGDRFDLIGGVRGLGGVLGRPIGERILGGVLERDLRDRLIGLCLKILKTF